MTETAVLRRMLFATSYLPGDLTQYWDVVASFGNQGSTGKSQISASSAKTAMENLQVLNAKAFCSDAELTKELIATEYSVTKQELGVPLVPDQTKCYLCSGKLLLRRDHPSRVTLYTDTLGTVTATHFHKYCQNNRKGCKLVQFYGYYKAGDGATQYCENWMTLPYFLSSQETGFEMAMLKQFDVELLVGQVSYKQKAYIYNLSKGYDTTQKECTTTCVSTKLAA